MNHHEPGAIVVGVDVGGPQKGCHAVALQDGQYREQLSTLIETQGTGGLFLIAFPATHPHEELAECHCSLNLSTALELWQCPPSLPCRTWRRQARGSVYAPCTGKRYECSRLSFGGAQDGRRPINAFS